MRFYLGIKGCPESKEAPKILIKSKVDPNFEVSLEESRAIDDILWWLNKALAYADSFHGKCTRWVQIES
jgi:hypothetical protein